jgi:hypothetical protein
VSAIDTAAYGSTTGSSTSGAKVRGGKRGCALEHAPAPIAPAPHSERLPAGASRAPRGEPPDRRRCCTIGPRLTRRAFHGAPRDRASYGALRDRLPC